MAEEHKNKPKITCGKGLTEQSHQKQTDINYILKDYVKTGLLKHAKDYEGQYDDVSSVDFEKAMNTVAQVNSMFEELPSKIRAEFKNSPQNFLEFAQDYKNAPALEAMGISKGIDGFDISGARTLASVEAEAALVRAKQEAIAAVAAESQGDSGAATAAEE